MRSSFVFLVTIFTFSLVGCEISEMSKWGEKNVSRIKQEFGFSHGSPYFKFGKTSNETFTFEKVDPDGIIGRSGIKSGDIILTDFPWPTTYGLHRYLDENRGEEVKISVTDGGDGPPLKDRAIRTYIIKIPN